MAFSTFSKDFTANMFTSVENQFITKYLPIAEGDAVRVYLYGLYLCQCAEEFDALSCAKLLKLTPKRLLEAFEFWEECDLVHILSREPLYVQYLPVNAAIGKPKPIRAEKYAEFNRAFFKQLQTAGVMFKPFEHQRILEFLENNQMEQQAFLLVSEYCAKKDGKKLSSTHILNKAKKLCADYKFTYDQVERELADFNNRERDLSRLFALLSIVRKPKDEDYEYLERWAEYGMDFRAVCACAGSLKKGSLATLDSLVGELHEKNARSLKEAEEYLAWRDRVTKIVFDVAKKLGVKASNPRVFGEEYVEKWLERGYDEESLYLLATLGLKMRFDFAELDALLDTLYANGVVDIGGVSAYCSQRESELRLLQRIQTHCGVMKKTQSTLDMVATWRSWSFSDEMILEAAKRSANADFPLPYINKLLSEWKRVGAFTVTAIPEAGAPAKPPVKSEATVAADMRAERERYYSILRANALERAENARKKAEKNAEYKSAITAIKRGEIELAKAEVFSPENVLQIKENLQKWITVRDSTLSKMGLSEQSFEPIYQCKKCSDTGFLPNGRMCDCYPEKN